jgi:hypothetical protein
MVFRPYMRSSSAQDHYAVYERPASGTAGQKVLRYVAPDDTLTVWFHRNFARTYIEHRIDTVGCASPENASWFEVYDPYNEGAQQHIQPHAQYTKHNAVASFKVDPDTSICSNNLVPVTLTATGIGLGAGGFVWQPADGLALSDTSLPTVVVNPAVTTVYKGVLRLGDGCDQYDSAIVEVFSVSSDVPQIRISSNLPQMNDFLPLCGGGDSVMFEINAGASSPLSSFKRVQWYVNNTLVATYTGDFTRKIRLAVKAEDDSVYVKAYLADNLRQCATDTEFVSNVYRAKIYNAPTVVAATDTTVCYGANVLLVFGGSGAIYLLYEGAARIDSSSTGVFVVAPDKKTTYTVRAYSEWAECYSTDSVTVSIGSVVVMPVVSISASVAAACGKDSVAYRVDTVSPDVVYHWYVNGVATGVTGTSYSAVLNSNDTVQCKAVYGGTECVRPEDSAVWSNRVAVLRSDYPALKRIQPALSADTVVCKGLFVPLSFDVSSGAKVEWTPTLGSSASVVVAPAETTTYRLRVWFDPHCAVSDTVRVVVNEGTRPTPSVTISSSASAEICGGDTLVTYMVASCTSCDSLVWYVGGKIFSTIGAANTGSSITRTIPVGFDTVYARAYRLQGSGCDIEMQAWSNLIVINRQVPPTVRISPRDTTIDADSELVLYAEGAANFVWGPVVHFANSVTGSPVVAEPLATTQIYVTGYNYTFCTGADAITVTVAPKPIAVDSNFVYIPNAIVLSSTREDDHIFKIQGIKVAGADIKIFSANGSVVFSENGIASPVPYIPVWRVSEASIGNYNYRISVELTDGEVRQFRGWISVIK